LVEAAAVIQLRVSLMAQYGRSMSQFLAIYYSNVHDSYFYSRLLPWCGRTAISSCHGLGVAACAYFLV
jgi:hypothetical protein